MYNNNNRAPWVRYVLAMVAIIAFTTAFSNNSRFRFLNNKTQTTFNFQTIDNLIVIPVAVNDMELNLILDTGMRSIVLFGRRFGRKLETLDDVTVRLSGYGRKKNRPCKLSLGNDIVIADVLGSEIGIVIMPNPDLFRSVGLENIDGVIGYEIFSRFIVKIDYPGKKITLYEPTVYHEIIGFESLPLVIEDTKPYIQAMIESEEGELSRGFFHVDTGSAQDIMLFLSKGKKHGFRDRNYALIGMGIGGRIRGFVGKQSTVHMGSRFSKQVIPKYVERGFSNKELQNAKGSIGSGFLKDSVIILDYMNMLFYLKRQPDNKSPSTYNALVKVDV